MSTLKHMFILFAISFLPQIAFALFYPKLEILDAVSGHLIIIFIIILALTSTISHFVLRLLLKESPSYLKELLFIISAQSLSVFTITMYHYIKQTIEFVPDGICTLQFNYAQVITQILVFGWVLPFIVITPLYLLDKPRNNFKQL